MIEPSLRIKVTDFLATDYEQDVFQKLMKIKQLPEFQGAQFPLYFWYDREYEHVDLSVLKDFIVYWKSTGEYGTKLSLHPEPFDDGNHFIWYDIKPNDMDKKLKEKLSTPFVQYYRFAYTYSDPRTGILEGLEDFVEKYRFVTRDNSSVVKRKQKETIMKIAIIGSRNYTNKTQIKNFMFRLKMEHKGIEIISGGAKDGADKYAKTFALEFGLDYSEFPPQHETHNIHCVMEAFNYGKPYNVGYYHKRNKDLVKYSDKVVAFIKDDIITNGTKSALEYCKKINKKFVILS